jgi:hypothetical protein
MEKLARRNPAKAIDLLGERLAFERASVELYDRLVARVARSSEPEARRLLRDLGRFRGEEQAHADWLVEHIQALGGDADAEGESARLVKEEATGIEKVGLIDAELPHLFHALLAAELVDGAGWDLLVRLADDCDDPAARADFLARAQEEGEHLHFARIMVERFAEADLLGLPPRAP